MGILLNKNPKSAVLNCIVSDCGIALCLHLDAVPCVVLDSVAVSPIDGQTQRTASRTKRFDFSFIALFFMILSFLLTPPKSI